MNKSRIGVFVCHCGLNIAATVDVARVVEAVRDDPGVAYAAEYKYMCSDPGQNMIKDAVREHNLDGVVVAACSPAMHQVTFRKTVAGVGMNPYRMESANIREQVSWVHQDDPERATLKAIETVRTIVEKVRRNEPLEPIAIPVNRRALVIGGGVAGLTAALDIADAGYPVILVERADALGGKMRQLSGTYLNFDAAPDMLAKRVARVQQHPHIQVLTSAEVMALEGYVGNFTVRVSCRGTARRAQGEPADRSDTPLPPLTPKSLSHRGRGDLKSPLRVRSPSPLSGRGGQGDEGEESFTFDVGAVVVATGWDSYPMAALAEYGAGEIPDVIDYLAFERMLAPGEAIRRPSDGRTPREVVFVQCAGSRDPANGVPYCSKVCCMVVPKQAMLLAERVPGAQAYVFYTDIRSAGKNYDEYVQRAMSERHVLYLRGKVSRLFREGDRVMVWGEDTLSGQAVEIAADLVVLATPLLAAEGARELAQRLRISTDAHGFYNEAHPKLRPVETLTAGVFVAGAGQGPKDIPETVAEASGAAAKALQLFAQDHITQEPTVAVVDADLCAACGACVEACPYGARSIHPVWHVATVQAALCQGCGACVAACPNKACSVRNWTPEQILGMADLYV
ncbi:MAG: CoB--CoM heterodisulfide reductase iron-sulfur subunit A family protein [Anaerolineae bacterium]|nr:CoB--CoM heterodisulfide reductase iron-sulfur subunit A family protein [Anaerolineae bacterium]